MRVELYGCMYDSALAYYQAPPGDLFSPHLSLKDIYDGYREDNLLTKGLGLLTDGHIGSPLAFNSHVKDQGIYEAEIIFHRH